MIQLLLNWKTLATIGLSAIGIILAIKVEPSEAKDALVGVANATSSAVAPISK